MINIVHPAVRKIGRAWRSVKQWPAQWRPPDRRHAGKDESQLHPQLARGGERRVGGAAGTAAAPSPVPCACRSASSRSKTTRIPCSTWLRPWLSADTRSAPPPIWPRPGARGFEDFDLVISDIGLQNVHRGWNLMDEIKRSDVYPGLRSAVPGSEEDIARSKAGGSMPIVQPKPINLQSLEATLRRVIPPDNSTASSPFISHGGNANGRH